MYRILYTSIWTNITIDRLEWSDTCTYILCQNGHQSWVKISGGGCFKREIMHGVFATAGLN